MSTLQQSSLPIGLAVTGAAALYVLRLQEKAQKRYKRLILGRPSDHQLDYMGHPIVDELKHLVKERKQRTGILGRCGAGLAAGAILAGAALFVSGLSFRSAPCSIGRIKYGISTASLGVIINILSTRIALPMDMNSMRIELYKGLQDVADTWSPRATFKFVEGNLKQRLATMKEKLHELQNEIAASLRSMAYKRNLGWILEVDYQDCDPIFFQANDWVNQITSRNMTREFLAELWNHTVVKNMTYSHEYAHIACWGTAILGAIALVSVHDAQISDMEAALMNEKSNSNISTTKILSDESEASDESYDSMAQDKSIHVKKQIENELKATDKNVAPKLNSQTTVFDVSALPTN